jgi:tetratricopeptide (TPR) repeat protein
MMSFNEASALPPSQKTYKLDQAHDLYQRVVSLDSTNREAYYSLGVIAWGKTHTALVDARAQLKMRPEDPGPLPDAAWRVSLQSAYGFVVEEGISNLEAALRLDPQYSDAMAYLNLLYRARADIRDSAAESAQDIAIGDQWLQRALTSKTARARTSAPVSGDTQVVPLGHHLRRDPSFRIYE